jgi:hypothetical protein
MLGLQPAARLIGVVPMLNAKEIPRTTITVETILITVIETSCTCDRTRYKIGRILPKVRF